MRAISAQSRGNAKLDASRHDWKDGYSCRRGIYNDNKTMHKMKGGIQDTLSLFSE